MCAVTATVEAASSHLADDLGDGYFDVAFELFNGPRLPHFMGCF
jgi:hypothetical protein